MMRAVSLTRLPQGLMFPDDLSQRIRFDPGRGQLQYDGFMSKRDFDKLIVLHNDLEYQRALEGLFQICVFEAGGQPGRRVGPVLCIAVAGLLLVSAGWLLLWMW